MNQELQEIKDFEREYQEKRCQKVEAFMKKNFPVGSRITRRGEEFEVVSYDVMPYQNPLLVCDKIIREPKSFNLYQLFEIAEKAEGGGK